jgi:4-hydroxy-3-methylbut-2-en-1-yl diphosphate reductase
VVRDMEEAAELGEYILGNKTQSMFSETFKDKCTPGFDITRHLDRIGVINQTTMLATETQEIAEYLKQIMIRKFGENEAPLHIADTRDTLCYATNENQDATYGLLETDADLAIVVGGYNSSNTSHLVELCERKFPTYFISSDTEIESAEVIHHFDYHNKKRITSRNYLPRKSDLKIVITSGASCPDSLLDAIMHRLNGFIGNTLSPETVIKNLTTFSANQHAN